MKKLVFACVALVMLVPSVVSAQQPNISKRREAIKKLEHWVGNWQGKGWISFNGQRNNFVSQEKVEKKLGGLALLVQGLHTADVGGRKMVVHDAMGILTFDEKKDEYRFDTYTGRGQSGRYRADLLSPNKLRWTIDDLPFGDMRYTIEFTQDTWREVGEMSRNGEWSKMFEMNLKKTAAN